MRDALPPVLLLDLDDTIVSFSAGGRDYWREAFREVAADGDLAEEDFMGAVKAVGDIFWSEPVRAHLGRLDLVKARRTIAAKAFEHLGVPVPGHADAIGDHMTWSKEEAVAPFPGAVPALEALRERGIRLGLVTNGSGAFQRRKLERYDLGRHFDAVLVEGEWGVGKPDASIFREALRRLGAASDDAWMVGDNLSADIGGARAVGLGTVWIDVAGTGLPAKPPAHPDHVVTRLADLV